VAANRILLETGFALKPVKILEPVWMTLPPAHRPFSADACGGVLWGLAGEKLFAFCYLRMLAIPPTMWYYNGKA